MINNRGPFRLRKLMDISWSVPEQKIEGKGKIFNISISGINFETDRLFQAEHGMSICFKSEQIPSLPPNGQLVWFKKVGEGKKHYQCGIRFFKDGASNREWAAWMEDNVLKLADTQDNKILNRFLTSEDHE